MPRDQSQSRLRQELAATLKLALPLAAAQLAQVAMGATDTILLGSLGHDSLAAGGLGANLFFTLMLLMSGLPMTVSILVSHGRGAGQPERIGLALRGGVVLALLASVPPMILLWHIAPLLRAIGEPADLVGAIGRYSRVLLWAMPASLLITTQRAYLAAMGRPWLVMVVSTSAVLMNGLLNYGLIHGAFGLPRLGFIGSATATLVTLWVMMAVIATSMRASRDLRRFRLLGPVDWRVVGEMARLGWPIALAMGLELLMFAAAGLFAGFFGPTALAAHQIAMNVASITFMIPLALSQAANVRVGFHCGRGVPRAARLAAVLASLCGIAFMSAAATIMLTAPHLIAGVYIGATDPSRAEVIALTARLLAVAALFQVFDGAQVIAAGALRGLKDTQVTALAAGIGYWGVGLPTAWLLADRLGLGVTGLWWGLAAGLASVAILLSARFWLLSGRLISDDSGWSSPAERLLAQTSIAE